MATEVKTGAITARDIASVRDLTLYFSGPDRETPLMLATIAGTAYGHKITPGKMMKTGEITKDSIVLEGKFEATRVSDGQPVFGSSIYLPDGFARMVVSTLEQENVNHMSFFVEYWAVYRAGAAIPYSYTIKSVLEAAVDPFADIKLAAIKAGAKIPMPKIAATAVEVTAPAPAPAPAPEPDGSEATGLESAALDDAQPELAEDAAAEVTAGEAAAAEDKATKKHGRKAA